MSAAIHETRIVIRGDGAGGVTAFREVTRAGETYRESLNRVDRASRRARGSSNGMAAGFGNVVTRAGAAVTAVTGVIGVLTSLGTVMRTDVVQGQHALAQSIGMATSELQAWEYAGSAVALTAEQMGGILKDANEKFGEFAKTGGGEVQDVMEGLNISMSEMNGLAPDERLMKVAEALAEVSDAGERSFYLESLGNDATKLAPLLENDAALLRQMQQEARVFGVSMTAIEVEKLSQADRAFGRVRGVATGMVNDLSVELAPVLSDLSDRLVQNAIDAGGFGDAFASGIDTVVGGVGTAADYLQQLQVWVKQGEVGFLHMGVAASGAMMGVSDSVLDVINGALYPWQLAWSSILDQLGNALEWVATLGGPLADEFEGAARSVREFSGDLLDFRVTSEGVEEANDALTQSLAESADELKALLSSKPPSEAINQWLVDVRAKSDQVATAQIAARDSIKKTGKVVADSTEGYSDLVSEMEDELELMRYSGKERQVQIALRKLDADATDEQREKVRALAEAIYDKKAAVAAAGKEAEPFRKSWEEAVKRIDESFADAWKGSFDSFGDFADRMLDSLDDMLMEMAHQAITKPIVLNIQSSVSGALGIGGSGSSSAAGGLPGGLPSGMPDFAGLADTATTALDFFNPASGGATAFINNQAQSFGYGMAADGMGPPSQLLIDPSGGAAAGLNAIGPGLAAFGLSKQYGPLAGVAGGAGSAALAGGVSSMIGGGGFMTGASGALAGLGPVGWGAIALGSILGMMGPKPSDKTQWAGMTGGDGYVYSGGENGDKAWQEGRDAATQIAALLGAFDANLAKFDGVELTSSYEVGVGQRDGAQIRVSDAVENASDLKRSPNGSEYFSGGEVIFSGTDLAGGFDAAFDRMASESGLDLSIFSELALEGEIVAGAYERVHLQAEAVAAASDVLGLKFDASASDQLRLADQLVQSAGGLAAFNAQNALFDQQFFTNAERQQRVYDGQLTRYDELESVLRANNLQLDGSKDAFRELITGIDGSTLAGAELRAELLQYQGTVAFLAPAMVAANEAGASGVEVFYDLQGASESLVDTISRVSSEVETFTEYNTTLGWGLQLTGDELISVADGFIQSAGGMQQFSSQMNSGMSLLYTDAERASMSALDAARNLGALNAQQGLYGDQLVANLDQARAYAEAQDLSTAAGQRAYLAAIEMAQAIDALGGSLSGATAAAGNSGSSGGGGVVSSSPGVMIDIEQLQDELAAAQAAQITATADTAAAIADAQEKIDYYSTYWGGIIALQGQEGITLQEAVDLWKANWTAEVESLQAQDDGSTAIADLTASIAAAQVHNAEVQAAQEAQAAAQAAAAAAAAQAAAATSSSGSSYVAALQLQPGALEQLMQSVLSESGYLDWLIEQRQQPIDEYNSLHDTAIAGFADLAAVVEGLEAGSDAWIEAVNVTGDLSAWLDAQAQLAALQQAQVLAEYQPDIDGYWQQYLDAEGDLQRLYDDRLEQLKAEQGLVAELGRMQDSLALSAQSPLTPQQRYDEAQAQYREVLAAVQGGDTDRLSELQSAGQAYLTESQSMYGSSAGALSVYSEVSGALEDLALTLDSSSYDDQLLTLEREQQAELDGIRGALESQLGVVMSQSQTWDTIADLIAALPGNLGDAISGVISDSAETAEWAYYTPVAMDRGADTMQRSQTGYIDGSHFNGLPRVPFDGYIGELHRDEAVLTAPQAEVWRAGQSAPPLPLLAPLPPPVPVIRSASRADNAAAERELRAMSATIAELSETIERLMSDQVEATHLQTTRVVKQLKISPRRATSRTPRD